MTEPTTTLPGTSLPCPEWCDRPHGHPFDTIGVSDPDAVSRAHDRELVELCFDRSSDLLPPLRVPVILSSIEEAAGDGGPVLQHLPVEIVLDMPSGQPLTGSQARAVAAALLNAADEWDRIVAGGQR